VKVKILLLMSVLLGLANHSQAQWTKQTFPNANNIWMRLNWAGTPYFDFRISCGGTIGDFRDANRSSEALLSPPPVSGNLTDRIIQWVWWSDAITWNANRYNTNQGGNYNGAFSPTYRYVTVNSGVVDVYSSPQDQWQPTVAPHLYSKICCMTRYELMTDTGCLKIRRISRVPAVSTDFGAYYTTWSQLYDEAWTPFNYPGFTAMAMAVDSNCNPTWWYRGGTSGNIPRYPHWDVNSTMGYAMVYNESNPNGHSAVGLVFGTKEPVILAPGVSTTYVYNCQSWNNGIGCQPGLTAYNIQEGSIIDQVLYIVPRPGRNASLASAMSSLAASCEAPVIYPPGYAFTGEMATIVANINALYSRGDGVRTQNLDTLAAWQ